MDDGNPTLFLQIHLSKRHFSCSNGDCFWNNASFFFFWMNFVTKIWKICQKYQKNAIFSQKKVLKGAKISGESSIFYVKEILKNYPPKNDTLFPLFEAKNLKFAGFSPIFFIDVYIKKWKQGQITGLFPIFLIHVWEFETRSQQISEFSPIFFNLRIEKILKISGVLPKICAQFGIVFQPKSRLKCSFMDGNSQISDFLANLRPKTALHQKEFPTTA